MIFRTLHIIRRLAHLMCGIALLCSACSGSSGSGSATSPTPNQPSSVSNNNGSTSGTTATTNPTDIQTPETKTDTTPPSVDTISPENNASVASASVVTAQFSESLDPSTVSNSTVLVKDASGNAVGIVVGYNEANRSILFIPASPFKSGATYTATLSPNITDRAGNHLTTGYTWSFNISAKSDTTAPTISSVSPADNSTSVQTGAIISATFSEPLNAATLTSGTMQVTDKTGALVSGTIAYDSTNTSVLFIPTTALAYDDVYTVTLKADIQDTSSNALASAYTWHFTAVSAPPPPPTDTTPPTVVSVSPADASTTATRTTFITAKFSEALDPSTIDSNSVSVTDSSGNNVSGTIVFDAVTLSILFIPANQLQYSGSYTVSLHTTIIDLAKNPMASTYSWNFTVVAAPPKADTTPPTVTNTDPLNNAANVLATAAITAQFSEALDPASVVASAQSVQVKDGNGTIINGVAAYDTNTKSIVFIPSGAFQYGEKYTITLGSGITDTSNNALASPYSWSITTALTPPDYTPPYVKSVNPAANSQGVQLNTLISAQFSEVLDPASISNNVFHVVTSGGVAVSGTVAYDSVSSTLQFTPSAPFADGDTYTATLTPDITDASAAKNHLAATYAWTFIVKQIRVVAVSARNTSLMALQANGSLWMWGQNHQGQLGDGTFIDRNRPVHVLDNISTVMQDLDDPYSQFRTIAQGNTFSLAVDNNNHVWAWGSNAFGQLGKSDYTLFQKTPQLVVDAYGVPLSNIKAVAAGSANAYALTNDNQIWAWGGNAFGQTGNATIATQQPSPQLVDLASYLPAGYKIRAMISLTTTPMILVQTDPNNILSTQIWGWGYGSSGVLGSSVVADNTTPHPTPVNVNPKYNNTPIPNIIGITAGAITAGALTQSGDFYTWGSNVYQEIGRPGGDSPSPYLAAQNVAQAYMNYSRAPVIVQKTDGTIWAWGDNLNGKLVSLPAPVGSFQTTPAQFTGMSNIQMAATSISNVVYLKDNTVFVSGLNLNGELGDGSADFASYRPYQEKNAPIPLADASSTPTSYLPTSQSMSGEVGYNGTIIGDPGHDELVIADQNGAVWAQGFNANCELGLPNSVNTQAVMTPTQVASTLFGSGSGQHRIVRVSRGFKHALALDDTGHVWAWGQNVNGQLGRGTTTAYECTPQMVVDASGTPISNITSIAAAFTSSFAIQTTNGVNSVLAWGNNDTVNSNLGIGVTTPNYKSSAIAVPFFNGLNVQKISSGARHVFAVTDDGKVYGWGNNGSYQAGDATSSASIITPKQLSVGPVRDACSAGFASVLLLQDGTVWAWGLDTGLGTADSIAKVSPLKTPSPVQGVSNIKKIACEGARGAFFALTNDGHLWSFGQNLNGEMGMGNTVSYTTAQQVPDPSGAKPFDHVVDITLNTAVRDDGSIWKFGYVPDGDPIYKALLSSVVWPY